MLFILSSSVADGNISWKKVVVHAGALNEISHRKNSIQFISCSLDPKGVLTHRIKNMSIYKYTSMYNGITHYTGTSDDTP
jgi:glycerol-3-phosphate responsive antiterminator